MLLLGLFFDLLLLEFIEWVCLGGNLNIGNFQMFLIETFLCHFVRLKESDINWTLKIKLQYLSHSHLSSAFLAHIILALRLSDLILFEMLFANTMYAFNSVETIFNLNNIIQVQMYYYYLFWSIRV